MTDGVENNTEKPKGVGGNGNLIPPVKGERRNPNGRGKGVRNRSTVVREIIEAAAAEALKSKSGVDLGVQPQTIFDQLVLAQVIKASMGDTTAINFLADSAFGKLTDKVNTTHSFRKMGDVLVSSGAPDAPVKALSFDIGEEPQELSDSVELEVEEDDSF